MSTARHGAAHIQYQHLGRQEDRQFKITLSYTVWRQLKPRGGPLSQEGQKSWHRLKLSNFEDCPQGPEAGVDREEERERGDREG